MLYEAITIGRVYKNQKMINFPKGDPFGYGYSVILDGPSYAEGLSLINDPIFRWRLSGYKRYLTDFKYHERIGNKNHIENRIALTKQIYNAAPISDTLTLMLTSTAKSLPEKKYNILYDIDYYNEMWFKYRKTINAQMMCEQYTEYFMSKINPPELVNHEKIIMIPIDLWAKRKPDGFGITKNYLSDPISIMMCAIFRFPEIAAKWQGLNIFLVDASHGEFLRIDPSLMNKKKFSVLKASLKKMTAFKINQYEENATDSMGNISDDAINQIEGNEKAVEVKKDAVTNTVAAKVVSRINSNQASKNTKKSDTLSQDGKEPIKNSSKVENIKTDNSHMTTSTVNQISSKSNKRTEKDVIDRFEKEDKMDDEAQRIRQYIERQSEIIDEAPDDSNQNSDNQIDGEVEDEVKAEVKNAINTGEDPKISTIEKKVKEKVLVSKFKPDIDDEESKRIQEYMKTQNKIIDQSVDEMKSKIIPTADIGKVVKTSNQNLAKPKAKEFYHAYATQKFESDIDNAVASLSKADYPLVVVDKKVEDTSDPMNLKQTFTYTLKDKDGLIHTIIFDMPILIDDRYIYLGGNKKIIQNELILKPIIKSGPDEVQIVTFYNKIFIKTKGNKMDVKSESLRRLLMTDAGIQVFKVRIGNSIMRNQKFHLPLDMDMMSNNMTECTIGGVRFILDAPNLLKWMNARLDEKGDPEIESLYTKDGKLLVGYKISTKEPVYINVKNGETIIDKMIENFTDKEKKDLLNNKFSGNKMMYSTAKIYSVEIPLVLLICYCIGLTEMLNELGVPYKIVEPGTDYDIFNESAIRLQDKWIIWKRYPYHYSLLLNGLAYTRIEQCTLLEADSKNSWASMLPDYYKRPIPTISVVLDQFQAFMIDPVSAEVLQDMNLPTEFTKVLIVANYMLNGRSYQMTTDMRNCRLRSTEILVQFVYKAIADSYIEYRKSLYKKKPQRISVAKNLVMKNIYGSKADGKKLASCAMVEDASVLNPVLELEKQGAVSYRGPSGINEERAMTLPKRSYNESMAGTIAVSTSPDANVGIQRQLTLDPDITSTRGYINPSTPESLKDKNNVNLMSPAELLSPPGALHDDAHRTSMSYKQSKYMVLVDDASPVLVGNKVESAIPYYMSREFIVTAKNDGKVIDIDHDIVVIEYKDGTHDSFSLSPKEQKNSAGGFYIETKFQTDLKIGDKVHKDEVVAYNPQAFSKDHGKLTASLNIGVLCKVAVLSNFDEYEDSAPITTSLATRLGTTIVTEQRVVVKREAFIQSMVKIGDHVEIGDPLIVYDNAKNDADFSKMLAGLLDTFDEQLVSSAIISKKADHTGEIADIKFYSTVSGAELSDTLKPYVTNYWKKIKQQNSILEKYKNENDPKFYQCGQQITEIPGPVEAKFGKVLGEDVEDGVLIRFFIKHKDLVKKGDKVTNYTALKGVVSNVIDKGEEPFSEYRKDEEISTMIAPSAILARKTPSIFISMWSNKVMIELKRHLKDLYLEK